MWNQLRDASMTVGYVGGWCLKYVQDAFGTDHPYPTAIAEWNATSPYNHTERPPAGITVPVYLSLGNVPAGHVAISLSDGYIASSTQAGSHPGPYFHKNLDDLISVYGKYNGGATYLGWSEVVGSVQVVEALPDNATDDQIRQAYLDILERPVDANGLAHYHNYTNDFVRADLLNSDEYRLLQAHKAAVAVAQAQAAADQQAAADAKVKAEADSAAQVQADAEARQKAIDVQAEADAAAGHIQNPTLPDRPANSSLFDWLATIVGAVINWLKTWRK